MRFLAGITVVLSLLVSGCSAADSEPSEASASPRSVESAEPAGLGLEATCDLLAGLRAPNTEPQYGRFFNDVAEIVLGADSATAAALQPAVRHIVSAGLLFEEKGISLRTLLKIREDVRSYYDAASGPCPQFR